MWIFTYLGSFLQASILVELLCLIPIGFEGRNMKKSCLKAGRIPEFPSVHLGVFYSLHGSFFLSALNLPSYQCPIWCPKS